MHLNLICQYFFGRDDPYQHPEFNGAHQGFNIALGKKKKQTMIGHCDLDSFKALIGGIYNRRIEQVEDILTHLQFRAPANFDKVEGLRRDIFQLRFLRWIRGVGYPRSVRGKFVSAKEFKAQRKNKLLRAEAFLYSMTGMHVIHPDPEFVLTVCRLAFPVTSVLRLIGDGRLTLSAISTMTARKEALASMTALPQSKSS
jgi:hypothetical protein